MTGWCPGDSVSETTLFGTNEVPVAIYQRHAHDLDQAVRRSELESHFLASDRPTALLSPAPGAARMG
jgi:hypothetical protein